MLAGSDMVSFFLFSNMPGHKIRVIIATNHANYAGPRLMRKIEGLVSGDTRNNAGRMKPEIQIDLCEDNEVEKRNYTGPLLDKLPVNGAGPVSYTHLDVYKRQVFCYSIHHLFIKATAYWRVYWKLWVKMAIGY